MRGRDIGKERDQITIHIPKGMRLLNGTKGKNVAGKGWQIVRVSDKIGRNDPCPCGSGKKYKKCCQ